MYSEENFVYKLRKNQKNDLMTALDKGIDDMEAGRTTSHEEAMKKIREAVSAYDI